MERRGGCGSDSLAGGEHWSLQRRPVGKGGTGLAPKAELGLVEGETRVVDSRGLVMHAAQQATPPVAVSCVRLEAAGTAGMPQESRRRRETTRSVSIQLGLLAASAAPRQQLTPANARRMGPWRQG